MSVSQRSVALWTVALLALLLTIVALRAAVDRAGERGTTGDAVLSRGARSHVGASPTDAGNAHSDSKFAVAREPSATALIRGRVLSAEGQVVADAEVSWIARPAGELTVLTRRDLLAERENEAATTSSNDVGEFEFAVAPLDADAWGSFMWITHAGHAAAWLALPVDRSQWPVTVECVLGSRDATTVRVVDEKDAPLEGAEVVHLALIDAAKPTLDAETARARRVFQRSWATDASALRRIAAVDGLQTLVARKGELVSPPWQGEDPFGDEIVLRVGPTFTVGGRVSFKSGEPDETPLQVHIEALAGKRTTELGAWTVAVGAWGPLQLPCVADPEVRFELAGGGALAQVETRPRPKPGEHLTVDFAVARGTTRKVRVVDGATEFGISGARVRVSSLVGPNEFRISEARTDAEGMAEVRGVGTDTLYIAAMANGYVKHTSPGMYFAPESTDPYEARLTKGGKLVGRVLHEGQPLRDFEIVFWQTNPYPIQSRDFFRREDGRFEIDEVPLGHLRVVASTVELPACEPLTVEVSADEPAEVEIVLPSASRARGRVVDAASNEPVASARVQLWSHWMSTLLSKRGSPHPVDANGEFDLSGFQAGDEWFAVEASDYAPWFANVAILAGGTTDLGTIPLARRQDLSVRLLADAPVDFSQFAVEALGRERRPAVRFDASGAAVVRALEAGFYRVDLLFPDGSSLGRQVQLQPGRPWELQMLVPSVARLSLEVAAADAANVSGDLAVRAAFHSSSAGGCEVWASVSSDGRARLDYLPAGPLLVELLDSQQHVLGSRAIELSPGENSLRIELDAQRVVLRVVDPDAQPLPNTEIWLCAPEHNPAWSLRLITAEDGAASIPVLSFEHVVGMIYNPSFGAVLDIPLDLSRQRDEPIDLVLDAPAALRVDLRDGTLRLAALQLHISDRTGKLVSRNGTTNADGTYELQHVSESPFVVHVTHPGYWPTKRDVRSSRSGEAETMQARRLGSVTIRARDATSGAERVGQPIALRSLEFDVEVSEWITQGMLPHPVDGLVTDATGELTISGLPHGSYRWSANGAQGTLDVPPHASASVVIAVP